MKKRQRMTASEALTIEPILTESQNKKPKVNKLKAKTKSPDFLDKLREQKLSGDLTRLTVDLDANTYNKLENLCEFAGSTKATMIRNLIKEAVKLLDKKQ